MIGSRHSVHSLLRYRTRPDDGEALQTDVMRFMAILGLCLTAVFALVQSLPLEPGEGRRAESAQERAQSELLATQHALQQAQQRLATVESQLAARQHEREQAALELKRVTQRLQQGTESLQALSEQQRQMQAETRRLAAEQAQRTQALQALGRKLEQVRRASKQQRLAAAEAKDNERELPPAAIEPAKAITSTEKPDLSLAEQRQEVTGFLLRFASVEALDGLVRSGVVGFSGVLDRQAWKLSLNGEQPVFVAHAVPRQMHEMAPQTVPPHYLRAFRASVGDQADADVVWGVTLPQRMERQIQALTKRAQAGVLVIHADGEVRLTRGGRV